MLDHGKIIKCLATGWEEGLGSPKSTVTVSIFGLPATVDFAESDVDESSGTLLNFVLRGQAVPGVVLTPSHRGR
jgi:hypothetical protein